MCNLTCNLRIDGEPRLASLPESLRTPDLINRIRTEYGLAHHDFSMVVTDYDLIPDVREHLIHRQHNIA